MASLLSSERVRRKTRPPPEVTRFCEVRLSNDAFSQKKRSEVIKKDQRGKGISERQNADQADGDQSEFVAKSITSSEYWKTMKQVQGIAAELMDGKDRKTFEKQCGRLPGSKPPKNIKMPYPHLMHIRKLERERQRKSQELERVSHSGMFMKQKKTSQHSKRPSHKASAFGRWRDNLTSVDPPMKAVDMKKKMSSRTRKPPPHRTH